MEVRREDQEKINRFSSLHQKEELIEEELRTKIVGCHMLHPQLLISIHRKRRRISQRFQMS